MFYGRKKSSIRLEDCIFWKAVSQVSVHRYIIYQSFCSHLESLYVALDANFRMKQKQRGFKGDSGLVDGHAYFVNSEEFNVELNKYLLRPALTKETSACESSFAAIERAESRVNRGYSVTGVVAAIDSRHGFIFPNSVADLQKGER